MPLESITGERKFLHEISSPLAGLQMHLELLVAQAREKPDLDAQFTQKLEKCLLLFEKTNKILAARKEVVRSGAPVA